MRDYCSAMDRCGPDSGLEERLRRRVLAAGGEPARHCRVYRPRSFGRKLLLAAVIAAVLTASVGAALTQVPWDTIFAERFGLEAAASETAARAFQEVNVTSVCGDVTLTVRQAVGDDKTIYLILDLQLPQDVDTGKIQAVMESEEPSVWMDTPRVRPYATDEVTWADIQDLTYEEAEALLYGSRFPASGYSGSVSEMAFDQDTKIMTYLISMTLEMKDRSLTDGPMTLLVDSPALYQNGAVTPLSGHPAILTFQPDYIQQARFYQLRDGEGRLKYEITLSPFALSAKSYFGDYTSIGEFAKDVVLVYRDGSEKLPAKDLGWGGGGSRPTDSEVFTTLSFSCRFHEILDLDEVRAIRAGDCEISIEDWTA
ncbi:hypothetical protein SAMN05216343_108119 [Oscillibacter sp. PC13]|uniref:DUF4179 domain-containing protein n=1 Tax=Oscillibacter sp. PC13 TaxID=1855299 RepID=UPI0008E56D9F|nr:DUF4179 domain-containing protein [Oscillibacter sp. PC13]SFP51132.1 hypothetical protein SAMN05216343_108119 [Oscillibacter sp. PC13]